VLSEEQWKRREGHIGASFVPWLMAGDEKRMVAEWMRLVEHPDYVREDLSREWGPSFGGYVEPFALDWHEAKTGHALTRRGEWVEHPQFPYIGCTLDSYREADHCVLDCKVLSRWSNLDEQRAFYTPQLVVQTRSVRAQLAALLVVYGGEEPQEYPAGWDQDYERAVWERVQWFWGRVETLEPPCELPAVKGSVPAVKAYDMSSSNAWAAQAGAWLGNKDAAGQFASSAKELKGLTPPDAVRAYGHGIQVSRSKAGALTIREDS
jgi:predicted phage-related endonuclease